jgi:hypothetical protein
MQPMLSVDIRTHPAEFRPSSAENPAIDTSLFANRSDAQCMAGGTEGADGNRRVWMALLWPGRSNTS